MATLQSRLSSLITAIGADIKSFTTEFGKIDNTNISYTVASGLGARPTTRTGQSIRIWGGTTADPDPTWMIDGDYRDIASAT